MTALALAAVAVSAGFVLLLCLGDPKRRRTIDAIAQGDSGPRRRAFVVAACLPGLLCVVQGDAAGFLIWLGGTGAAGWLMTLAFSRSHPPARR